MKTSGRIHKWLCRKRGNWFATIRKPDLYHLNLRQIEHPHLLHSKKNRITLARPEISSMPKIWIDFSTPNLIRMRLLPSSIPVVRKDLSSLIESEVITNLLKFLTPPKILQKVYRHQSEPDPEATSVDVAQNTRVSKAPSSGVERERLSCPQSHDLYCDLLESIWPILLPPPGANLDSQFFLPPEKKLYPHQITGVHFLFKNHRALLADEMGLGKSIQAIVAMKILFQKGEILQALIVCPKIVLTDWKVKIREWAPELTVIGIEGTRDGRKPVWLGNTHISIVTYETLRQDINDIHPEKYNLVILDEAQKIKNSKARVTKSVNRLHAKRRWALTGTPLEKDLGDLHSILRYIEPDVLNYAGCHGLDEAWRDIMLRRKKEDTDIHLPPKNTNVKWLELSEQQRKKYEKEEAIIQQTIIQKGDTVSRPHIFSLISKLKQICNMDLESKKSVKLDYLETKLNAIHAAEEKALIFSQFPQVLFKPLIETSRLNRFNPVELHGGMTLKQRDQVVREFQNNDQNMIALLSVLAAGSGITLTRANHVFHFDTWWNPATAAQAEDRTHRIGQTKPVYVYYLYTVNTIEERIYRILERKRELFNEVIEGANTKREFNKLTLEELLEIVGIPKKKENKKQVDNNQTKSKFDFNDIEKLDHRAFEYFTAKIFEAMQFRVHVTPQSRDGGIDLIASKHTVAGKEQYAVQCKHYPNNPVGVAPIRELYGVISAKQHFTKGYLVTSGTFSREARQFVSGKRIELWDGEYLQSLIARHNISV